MKRILLIVIVVAMFGWAIYDFVLSSDKAEDNGAVAEETEQSGPEVGLEEGNRAPDFELATLDGEEIKLSDLQGKPVFLNFFTSWCPPCRAEMPDMQRFYEDSDIQVLAVNMYEREHDTADVPVFIEEFDLSLPIVIDDSLEVTYRYGVTMMPTTYILNSEGIIEQVTLGPMNYDQMMETFSDIQ